MAVKVHAFTEFLAKLFGSRPRWDRTAIASAACFLTLRSPNLRSRLTALGKPETIALFSIDSNHRSGDEIEQSLVPEDSQHGTCLDPRHIGCGSWSCFCPRQNAADAEPNVVRAPGKYGRLPDPEERHSPFQIACSRDWYPLAMVEPRGSTPADQRFAGIAEAYGSWLGGSNITPPLA